MKKIIISLLLCCPLMCAAQSEWELPTAQKNAQEAKNDKAEKNAEKKRTADLENKSIKDWKYIQEGAVPEVNGKIMFKNDIQMPGKTAQQIYDLAYTALDSLTHTPQQINSSIALINKKEHSIVARCQEWLEFSKNFISIDRTKFNYYIMANCSDGCLHLSIERISYAYEEDRPTGFKVNAEKWISDKYGVNKKRTKLTAGSAKFRKKTIDRKNEIFRYIEKKMKGME